MGTEGAAPLEELPLLPAVGPLGEHLPGSVGEPVLREALLRQGLESPRRLGADRAGLLQRVHELRERPLPAAELGCLVLREPVAAGGAGGPHHGLCRRHAGLRRAGPGRRSEDRADEALGAREAAAGVLAAGAALAGAPEALGLVEVPAALRAGAQQPVLAEVGDADLVARRDVAAGAEHMDVARVVPECIGEARVRHER
mmetsp:Transcript_60986/g.178340  ORF Transcript_60986/g.178340 Transcript_60986/m.178340 type:complete len:200 (-) Transcript_60986:582-1181(-)